MDEFFRDVLFENIGAFVRFLFFSAIGRRKAFQHIMMMNIVLLTC